VKLITTEQASQILNVSPRTVSIWLKEEILPGFKIGAGKQAEWRIDEETLYKFILSRANKTQKALNEEQDSTTTQIDSEPINGDLDKEDTQEEVKKNG